MSLHDESCIVKTLAIVGLIHSIVTQLHMGQVQVKLISASVYPFVREKCKSHLHRHIISSFIYEGI